MAEKKKLKKPRWIDEFKNFAIKGNALSMAVGVIIGGGFSTITKSLTDDVIMPIVSMFLGGVNFSQWYLTLPQWLVKSWTRREIRCPIRSITAVFSPL